MNIKRISEIIGGPAQNSSSRLSQKESRKIAKNGMDCRYASDFDAACSETGLAKSPAPFWHTVASGLVVGHRAKNNHQAKQLDHCISQITCPAFEVSDLPKIKNQLSSILAADEKQFTANLWFGIAARLNREDSSAIFETLLFEKPNHRLALLNLCATSLTYLGDRSSGNSQRRNVMAEKNLARLQLYLSEHKVDPFSGLIEIQLMCQLLKDRDAVWEKLNKLYLEFPNYSPATSMMAALCLDIGLKDSARDFAEESIRKCHYNCQAAMVLFQLGARFDYTSKRVSAFSKKSSIRVPLGDNLKSILLAPYSIQDPLFNLDP